MRGTSRCPHPGCLLPWTAAYDAHPEVRVYIRAHREVPTYIVPDTSLRLIYRTLATAACQPA